MTARQAILAAAFSILLAGCNRDFAPVSGRVTLDGRPLSGAVVTFQPKSTREAGQPKATGSVGRTDSDGHYSLRVIHPEKNGAVVGEHSVTISAASGGSDETPAKGPKLPSEWTDGSKRFNVPPSGTQTADFQITTPKPGRQ